MRAAYLGKDRANLGNYVKNLARRMQQPREADLQRLKWLGRYVKGKPRVVQRFGTPSRCVKTMVDSDNNGHLITRRTTVGQVAFLGNHVVKHTCNLWQVVGLSSAENEYHVISVELCAGEWDCSRCCETGV